MLRYGYKLEFEEEIMEKLNVLDHEISVKTIDIKDFISLTDMLRSKDGDFFNK